MRARDRTALLLFAAVALVASAMSPAAAGAAPNGFLTLASRAFLPSHEGGCDAGTTANGVITIPIEVLEGRGAVEPLVNMCFDGKGPYPMVIDTGAQFSVITTEFAKELGLKAVGQPLGVEARAARPRPMRTHWKTHRSVGSNSKAATSSPSTRPGAVAGAPRVRSAPTSSVASGR